ncbi:hypothetical protein [uncultured Methanolobus sp.]|uniref:hypothetical protein n=1 Tax=uncultured Methanolobus sp. TaxID=218300 RepID=UPI002AABE04C|nr:hypothetical protein [uncultured Methanolobus sp.]
MKLSQVVIGRLKMVFKRLFAQDHIHSRNRLVGYVEDLVKISAALDNREQPDVRDVDLVEEIMSYTCKWVEPETMVRSKRWRVGQTRGYDDELEDMEEVVADMSGAATGAVNDEDVWSFIHNLVEEFRLYSDGKHLWEAGLNRIRHGLESYMGLSWDEAGEAINNYVAERGGPPNPSNVFERVEVISALKTDDEPFAKVLLNPGQDELHDIIVEQLGKHTYISKENFEALARTTRVGIDAINGHLSRLKRNGEIVDVDDGYRWMA